MKQQERSVKSHFRPYYHNNRLLLQFILVEFLRASEKTREVEQSLQQVQEPSASSACAMQSLEMCLENLAGSAREFMYQLPWNLDTGILTRLKDYSDRLVQNNSTEESNLYAIHDSFQKAWLVCKQTIDNLRLTPQPANASARPVDLAKIHTSVDQINDNLARGAQLIAEALCAFPDDENILFFLVRHHAQIAQLYGRDFLKKILRKMHFNEIRDARKFVVKRYKERGFEHMEPLILEKFDDAEQTLCGH